MRDTHPKGDAHPKGDTLVPHGNTPLKKMKTPPRMGWEFPTNRFKPVRDLTLKDFKWK